MGNNQVVPDRSLKFTANGDIIKIASRIRKPTMKELILKDQLLGSLLELKRACKFDDLESNIFESVFYHYKM